MDCVNKLVHASYTVYEHCEGNLSLGELDLKLLEHNFYLAGMVNVSIADQADVRRLDFYLAGNNHLKCPSAEEVNSAYYKRYNEVQLLFDDVKFKLDTIITDFATSAVHVRYTPPWLRATKHTLGFDSLTLQAASGKR